MVIRCFFFIWTNRNNRSNVRSIFCTTPGTYRWSLDSRELLSEAKRKKLARFHEVSTGDDNWFRAEKLEWLFPAPTPPSRPGRASAQPAHHDDSLQLAAPVENQTDSEHRWYLEIDGEPVGPMTFEHAVQKIRAAGLSGADEAWHEGLDDWMAIGDLEEFRGYIAEIDDQTDATVLVDRALAGSAAATVGGPSSSTSKMAIISLVCGLLLCFPFSIAAILFCFLAVNEIRNSNGQITGQSLAYAGGAIGLFALLLNFVALLVFIFSQDSDGGLFSFSIFGVVL